METTEVRIGDRFKALVILLICGFLFFPVLNWGKAELAALPKQRFLTYTSQNSPPNDDADYPVQIKDGKPTVDYWVVNCDMSKEALAAEDAKLEKLNADNVVQAAVLCMPSDQVSDVPGYALRFSRFMGMGNATGPRRDNGLVWIIVPNSETGQVEIRYAAGFGLTKLTAIDLNPIEEVAVKNYPSAGQQNVVSYIVDQTDAVARKYYEPLNPRTPQYSNPDKGTSMSSVNNWLLPYFLVLLALALSLPVLGSESILALFVILFGSVTAANWMNWPIWVITWKGWGEIAYAMASSSGGGRSGGYSSSSSGGSSGGGRSGGGGGSGRVG